MTRMILSDAAFCYFQTGTIINISEYSALLFPSTTTHLQMAFTIHRYRGTVQTGACWTIIHL